jgi:ribonucleoside-diphosphate reductase beta chain
MDSEPILIDSRTNLFPIKYEDIWSMYKSSVAAFWVPEEVSLNDDLEHWDRLDEEEKHFILMVLGFFANSDFIVNENLEDDFCERVKIPELKMFYHFQEMMEDIHTNMYQILIDALVKEDNVRNKLLNSVFEISSIKKKAEWARKWINNSSWVQRLIAFAIVEGIFFSGSFCSIFWLKKRGLMPGLCHSNELISRDEGMHYETAILVYNNYIVNKLDKDIIIEMIKDAVKVEEEFIEECLPYNLVGMNKELMKQYIRYVSDHFSNKLIGERIYKDENPFPWMGLIGMDQKTSFFEKKVSNYAKTSVITNKEEVEVRFDVDF